jgi:hypothetical protein
MRAPFPTFARKVVNSPDRSGGIKADTGWPNARRVTFDGHPDNLHWVWDTGLLQHITRDPEALAAQLYRAT